jgi:hypothetical protein
VVVSPARVDEYLDVQSGFTQPPYDPLADGKSMTKLRTTGIALP